MRSLVAFVGCPEVPPPAISWSGTDAIGRPLLLAHRGAAVAVAINEQRTVRAVLAGAVHNGRELRASLVARHAVGGRDDAEVVVHLYEERGIQCVKALRGAFALALWDERRQRLLLARDQLGLVPLYYTADAHRLAAASALPELLAVPGLAGTWDALALDAYLTLGAVPPPATFYTGIRQLGPGELAIWEGDRLRTQRYWQLTFPERRLARPDAAALLRAQLLEALRLRHAGVVAGLLMSGGLGSAALLALARAEGRLPTRAYTAADGAATGGVAGIAARAGVEHALIEEEGDPSEIVEALLGAAGAPLGGPEIAALQRAAACARGEVGVVLAGIGGEEIFGGSAPARAAERLRRYAGLPTLAREAAELWTRLAPRGWTPALRRLVEEQPLAPLERYARAVSLLTREERAALYTPEALAVVGEAHPWAALTALFADAVAAGASDPRDAIHWVELVRRLPALAEAARAACAGLDLRLPLADHRLAQFVASMPAGMRTSRGEGQSLLRAAAGELAPAAGVAARQPSVPADAIDGGRLAAQGIFRPEAVTRLRAEHARGDRDRARLLWAIALITAWLDRQPAVVAPVREAV
jgi:asparagine synthase (glutamine-hydrolysing)